MATLDTYYDWHKLHLMITDRCNLVCRMCPIIINDPKAVARRTMPKDMAFQVADFATRRKIPFVEISGGEATVVDYFWELLDRMCKGVEEVRLVTNGLMTKDEHIRTFVSYPNLQVQISIDGVDEYHNRIRGVKDSFERSADTLERLAAAGCKRMSINTVVQRSNLECMVDTYERFKHLPLLYHAFSLIEGVDSPEDVFGPEDHDEVISTLREIKDRAGRDGRDVVLSDELLRAYSIRTKYPHFTVHPGWGCSVVKRSVTVLERGDVFPCLHKGWDSITINRNLHERTIDEIVDAPEVRAEIDRARGPNGCPGCSTMCYNWDPEFRRKVMNPSPKMKAVQFLHIGKEYLRENHPGAFKVAKTIYRSLPS